jgi:hypothetical protein
MMAGGAAALPIGIVLQDGNRRPSLWQRDSRPVPVVTHAQIGGCSKRARIGITDGPPDA